MVSILTMELFLVVDQTNPGDPSFVGDRGDTTWSGWKTLHFFEKPRSLVQDKPQVEDILVKTFGFHVDSDVDSLRV